MKVTSPVRASVLNFSPQTVPGLDADALEKEVRDRLAAARIRVDDTAPAVLFIQIRYESIGSCPGYLLIHTLVAVSEEVQLNRRGRSDPLSVNTYEDAEHFIVPAGQSDDDMAGARNVAGDDVELIVVANIDEALAALERLGGDPLPDGRMTPNP